MKVIKIIVVLSNNGYCIDYYIDTENGKRECYNEQNVPYSIIHLMNYKKVSYHEKTDNKETFVYDLRRG